MKSIKTSNYLQFFRENKRYGLDFAIRHTLEMGFDAVEILDNASPSNWLCDEEKFLELKRKLEENKLEVSCYSMPINLLRNDVDDMLCRVFRHIEFAKRLGSPFFHHTLVPDLNFSSLTLSFDEVFEKVIDNADKIAAFCNQNGLVCLYEPQGKYFNGVENLKRLVDEMKRRGRDVAVCGDTGNSVFVDCSPCEIFKEFSSDIKHIHVKDYLVSEEPNGGEYQSAGGKNLLTVPIGNGSVDIKACIGYLKNYKGYFSVESFEEDEKNRQIEKYVI